MTEFDYYPPEAVRAAALDNVGRIQMAINSYLKRRPDLADWIPLPENLVAALNAAKPFPDESGMGLLLDGAYMLWMLPDQDFKEKAAPSIVEIILPDCRRLVLGLI